MTGGRDSLGVMNLIVSYCKLIMISGKYKFFLLWKAQNVAICHQMDKDCSTIIAEFFRYICTIRN